MAKRVKEKLDIPAAEYYQELTTKDVMGLVGLKSRQSIWRWVKEGKLPEPRYPAPHSPRWRLGEVLEHRETYSQGFKEAPRGLRGDAALEDVPLGKGREDSAKVDKLLERFGLRKST